MKKIFSCIVMLLMITSGVKAQYVDDNMLFNHLGASVSLGLDGIGIEAATTATQWAGVRAGINFFPNITVNPSDINYSRNVKNQKTGTYEKKNGDLGLEAKFKKVDGKILIDGYPFGAKSSFHVTAGLFFGNSEFITVNLKEDPNVPINGAIIPTDNNPNEYPINPNENGIIKLRMKYNSVKPYIGIGIGRAVPTGNKRIAVAADLGVQFHGSPKVQAYSPDGQGWMDIKSSDFYGILDKEGDRKDMDDAFDLIDKIKVWPVLHIRVTGRIF